MPQRAAFVDYEALYAAVNTTRQAQDKSWRELAETIGTSPSTFTRLAQGRGVDASTFAALVAWLNVDADRFIERRNNSPERGQTPTLAIISGHLRADKKLDPQAAKHLDSIIASAYKALTAEKKRRRAVRATRIQS